MLLLSHGDKWEKPGDLSKSNALSENGEHSLEEHLTSKCPSKRSPPKVTQNSSQSCPSNRNSVQLLYFFPLPRAPSSSVIMLFHRHCTFFTFQRSTLLLVYLYQKDERALPGNLQNRKSPLLSTVTTVVPFAASPSASTFSVSFRPGLWRDRVNQRKFLEQMLTPWCNPFVISYTCNWLCFRIHFLSMLLVFVTNQGFIFALTRWNSSCCLSAILLQLSPLLISSAQTKQSGLQFLPFLQPRPTSPSRHQFHLIVFGEIPFRLLVLRFDSGQRKETPVLFHTSRPALALTQPSDEREPAASSSFKHSSYPSTHPPPPPQALQSVAVDLGLQVGPPPFPPVSGHCASLFLVSSDHLQPCSFHQRSQYLF